MKNKMIKTRITVGVLAFAAVAGGILGVSANRQAKLESEKPDTITAQIIETENSEDETTPASANKNAAPMVPDIKKVLEEKAQKAKTENVKEPENTPENEPEPKKEEPSEDVFDPYSEEAEDVSAMDEFSLMWPIEGETLLAYSADRTVYDATLDQYRTNDSIWIAADPGDVVRAAESGTVASAESLPVSGNTVTLEHDNGWRTTYGQLESLLVEPGEEVFKGEIIGYVGQTTKYGVNQGDHLEFSVFVENESVDPKVAVDE